MYLFFSFENIVGKGQNAGSKPFPLSNNFLYTFLRIFQFFELSANAFNFDVSNILSFGKE